MTLHVEIEDLFKVLDKAADQEKVFEAAMKLHGAIRFGHFDSVGPAQSRLIQECEKYLDKWKYLGKWFPTPAQRLDDDHD